MNNHQPPGPPNGSNSEHEVDAFVEERLTEDRLNKLWDRLQGIPDAERKPASVYGWSEFITDCWITMKVTRALHKFGAAVAMAGAVIIAVLWFKDTSLMTRTPAGWQSVSGVRLPDTLRFRLGKQTASLEGGPLRLAGMLAGKLRSGTDLTTMDVTFNGNTTEGAPVTFRGTLVLTNAPGVIDVRRQRDFTGAWLTGELTVGTNAPVRIGQPYLPQ